MILAALLFALQQPTAPQDTTGAGRPCLLQVDSIGHQGSQQGQNIFGGGGVFARCRGTSTRLYADSSAWYAAENRLDLLGHVRIRDTSLALDASLVTYYRLQERLDAHNNVVAVNKSNGSVLRGPNLTYWRASQGIRDTVEMYATQRPTIEYRGAGVADTVEPYIIIADRVRLRGNDRMWAGGHSTIDRSDFGARSDSMRLDEIAGFAALVGNPRLEGKGPQGYVLTGTRIELGLDAREIRVVKALGDGKATSADWLLTADTIHLMVERRKLQQALAWGATLRPHAISSLQDIQADSLALDLPDQILTEGRGFGHTFSASRHDSSVTVTFEDCTAATQDCLLTCLGPEVNCIAGDTLTARWVSEPDSTGTPRNRIQRIVARGAARAVTHLAGGADTTDTGPSLNYSRGQVIDIALKQARIDRVRVSGQADGVHLEPRPAPPDTTAQKDST